MSATSPADAAAAASAIGATDSGASAAAAAAAAAAAELKSGNSSDVDSEMQSNKPLFLNFTAELAPFSGSSKKQKKKSNVYKVSGVNILNRNSVDSKTALERLQRRRENHNFVERRRRDNINHTIMSLSTIIPYCAEEGVKLNKGSILHMAVDYIHDLQDINQALAEENIRLGGNGNIQLPGRRHHRDSLHNSSADTTAQHSQDEDSDGHDDDDDGDDGERTLAQSLAASPQGASATSISTAVAAAIGGGKTPKRRRASPASSTKGSARKAAASATKRSKKSAETSASSSSTSIHSGNHHLSGVLSPSLTTAPPSAAQSANTSPVVLAASIGPGATPSRSAVHLPPTSAIVHKHQATLPPIGAVAGLGAAGGHVPLSAAAASTSIAPLMPIAHQHPHLHQQQQQPTTVRQPLVAQSMPSSPNFRAHFPSSVSGASRYADPHLHGGRQMAAINSHPFFTDVSSIRHHMQQQHQQQPQHNLPAVLENPEQADTSASNANTPYNSGRPRQQSAYYPQSLQNTPMMRPNREFAKGSDALELPSIVGIRLPPPPGNPEPQQHHR
ncbi:hypothetical protein LPJ53_004620 [Coemansia erecta]|uniref:BHLH domain-containing protein n=1 Tax=Coemansia erecta TaxID=147472 RepID=A0A9W8CPM0_9FUNG|nr:hypothetical protein LPJ53_004620 [Coemansia erecta]